MEKSIKRYMPIFVLPTFFAFILGFIVPFIMGIWLSFCKFTTVTDAKFVGFSNYIEALKDTAFRHSFWYTVLFAIASLLIINIIAFELAMALTKEMHGTNVFRTIFFMFFSSRKWGGDVGSARLSFATLKQLACQFAGFFLTCCSAKHSFVHRYGLALFHPHDRRPGADNLWEGFPLG